MSKLTFSKFLVMILFIALQYQFAIADYIPNFVKSAKPELQKRYEIFFQNPSPEEYDKLIAENYNQIGLISELLRRQAKSETNAASVTKVLELKFSQENYYIKDMVYYSAASQAAESSDIGLVKKFITQMPSPNIRASFFCEPIKKGLEERTEKSLAQLDEYIPLMALEKIENVSCYSYDNNGHQIATGLEHIVQSDPLLYQKLLNERVKLADKRARKAPVASATVSSVSSIYFCTKEQIASYMDSAMKEAKRMKPTQSYAFLNKNDTCQFGGSLTYTSKNEYEFNFIGNPGQGVFQIHFTSLAEGAEKLFPFQKQMPAGFLTNKDVDKYRKDAVSEAATDPKKIKPTAIPPPPPPTPTSMKPVEKMNQESPNSEGGAIFNPFGGSSTR